MSLECKPISWLVLPHASGHVTNSCRMQVFHNGHLKFWANFLLLMVHPLSRSDEVSGYQWQRKKFLFPCKFFFISISFSVRGCCSFGGLDALHETAYPSPLDFTIYRWAEQNKGFLWLLSVNARGTRKLLILIVMSGCKQMHSMKRNQHPMYITTSISKSPLKGNVTISPPILH